MNTLNEQDSIKIFEVPSGYLSVYISDCLPYLKKPMDLVADRSGIDDLVRDIYNNSLSLLVVTENDKVIGAICFCEQNYVRCKYLCVTMFGGDIGVLEKCKNKLMPLLDSLALKRKCKGVEWIGRKGWRNHAKEFGFSEQSVIYKKDL